jgi:hypothetical protein
VVLIVGIKAMLKLLRANLLMRTTIALDNGFIRAAHTAYFLKNAFDPILRPG